MPTWFPSLSRTIKYFLKRLSPAEKPLNNILKVKEHKTMGKKEVPLELNKEEKALSHSFDKGEWKSVKNLKAEKIKAKEAANRHLTKNQRINIRISESDLDMIRQRAAHEGMPYQTLIASVLHKYVSGHLENKRE